MSETEPTLEPIQVTKDSHEVVNENGTYESSKQTNGIESHDMEEERSKKVNGYEVNGYEKSEDYSADVENVEPVNGDYNEQEDYNGEHDLMGDDLPPPPEVVPDLPPPPQECVSQDLLTGDNIEEGSSVDPGVESSVDPEPEDGGEIECVDDNEDLMNVSDSEAQQGEHLPENIEPPPRMVEAVSEEELVSDGGLKEEVAVEIQDNKENEVAEQRNEVAESVDEIQAVHVNEGQLIDLGVQGESSTDPQVDPAAPCREEIFEPVGPEVSMEPEMPPECLTQQEDQHPEGILTSEGQEPVEELVEKAHEQQPMVDPDIEPVFDQRPVVDPVAEELITHQPEVKGEDLEVVPEKTDTELEQQVEEGMVETQELESQSQVGYAEPAIVVDNKPAEEEVPPPPPPPLVEATPPPPPPLDENIPLRRVSGSSTPNKQSPSKELESPIALGTPVSVAVVSPQENTSAETQQHSVPVTAPKPKPTVQATQPIAVVAPQMAKEEATPPSSPHGSASTTSEHAPSEGEKSEPQVLSSPQVSQKINKKNFKNKIKFGVDLVESSLKQLHFLYVVNKNPGLYEEWLFKKAVRRYEAFWLPLAAEHKKESLAAPLDIELVWHCHMLAPLAYEADCKSIAGLVVEHKLMSEKDRTKSLEKSRKYWNAKYPNEPFEIDLVCKEKVEEPPAEEPKTEPPKEENEQQASESTQPAEGQEAPAQETEKPAETDETAQQTTEAEAAPTQESAPERSQQATEPVPTPEETQPKEPEVLVIPEEGYEQKSVYNIWGSIARQRVFFYQVSLPHFHDKHFLKAAQKRYQRFLFLKHQNPLEVLVPCYDIDLMWHSHQLHPSVYKHDTVKVLGQILHHDDSVNDRSPGSKLVRADGRTRELWKEHFGDTFMNFGAMFRGEPPVLCERMSLIDPVETYTFSTKKATVNLDKVQLEGLPEEVKKFCVRLVYEGYGEKEGPMIKQFKGNQKKIEFENTKKGLAHFVFDTKEYERIKFNMSQQIGFACTGHDEQLGEQIFNLMPVVENIPKDQSDPATLTEAVKIDIDEEKNLTATFTATIEPPKQGPTMLYMNPGNYETRFCIMPEQIVQMWGPIPLPRLPAGQDNHCIVASHRFLNHTGEVIFTCRVIHSLPLLMSAVQVFFHSRMTAVAHLVGSDQIPLPSQLSDPKKVFSLNPGDGQRAVLIKNKTGDWGLLKGQWTGFRKYQPATPATKGKKAKKETPWNPGTLSLSFYKCATGAWQHLILPYQQENFRFMIQDANIDLRTGTIEINSESNEVAENLALAFSVALLHVLCQPRYEPPPPPEPCLPVSEAPPVSPKPKKDEEKKEEKAAEGEEKEPKQETEEKGGEGESKPEENEAKAEAPSEEKKEEAAPATPKTPKSPPPTPSKKVKELPPIPAAELGLILAAGYFVEAATNENIQRQYGPNACAGCVAIGPDVGIGMIGEPVADTAAEAETAEVADTMDNTDNAGDNGGNDAGDGDGGEQGTEQSSPDYGGMDADTAGMDAMGDVGDVGAASCAAGF